MRLPIDFWQLVLQQLSQPHLLTATHTSANSCATAGCVSLASTTTEHPLFKRDHVFSREDATNNPTPDKPWTLVQILVPVLVGVSTIVLFIIGYTVWYRWQTPSAFNMRNRIKRLFARRKRVRTQDRGDSWDIDGSFGMYYGRGTYQDPLHPNSPYWVSRAAQRVKASVQGSVSTVLRSLPTAPWNQPQQIIMSQRPRTGFHVDDQDAPSPVRTKRTWWRVPTTAANTGAASATSSGSGSSRVSESAPRMFSVVRGSGSSFDIVDQPVERDLNEEEQEKASLLPRSPTARSTRSGGTVLLISRNGLNFSIRTTTTSSAQLSSPATTVPPVPAPRPSAASSMSRRPLPPIPIPPVPVLPPPTQPTPSEYSVQFVSPPPLAHHRSSSSASSDGLPRKTAMRIPDSRHTSQSSISLQIPPPPPREPDQLTSLPSPGSPAYSGMPTPVTPPPPDRLVHWRGASDEKFYQTFPSRSRSLENIDLAPQGQWT